MLITFPENSFISKSTVPASLLKMFFAHKLALQMFCNVNKNFMPSQGLCGVFSFKTVPKNREICIPAGGKSELRALLLSAGEWEQVQSKYPRVVHTPYHTHTGLMDRHPNDIVKITPRTRRHQGGPRGYVTGFLEGHIKPQDIELRNTDFDLKEGRVLLLFSLSALVKAGKGQGKYGKM